MAGRTTGGRGSSSALVYVDEKSVRDLQNLAKAFKAQSDKRPSPLTKMLNKEIRDAAEPMRADIATAAEKLTFQRTSKQGGSRGSRNAKITKTEITERDEANVTTKLYKDKNGKVRERKVYGRRGTGQYRTKKRMGRGLRKSIAVGVRTQISTGANTAGVRVRLASKDPEVNLLGKRLNQKGAIRHPLFGDKDHWYETRATGSKGWFYSAAAPHRKIVATRVQRVLDTWTRKMAGEISRLG
jgi:hypothetical protein